MKKLFGGGKSSKPKGSKDGSTEEPQQIQTPIHASHAKYLTKPSPQQRQRQLEQQQAQTQIVQQQTSTAPSPVPPARNPADDERWEDVHYPDPHIPSAPAAIAPSRSSSFNSTPPAVSPSISSPHPRPVSPSGLNGVPRQMNPADAPGARPPKKPAATAPVAAINILKALDPQAAQANQQLPRSQSEEAFYPTPQDRYSISENGHAEKREKRGFWSTKDKDRDKPQDRDRERERQIREAQAQPGARDPAIQQQRPPAHRERREHQQPDKTLTSMIGYLAATASEDWMIVLEVCERASATEVNAKEAIRALRSEFKYGQPPAQLAASKLWAFMLRNGSDVFIAQSRSRKFLDAIEQIIKSSQTNPVVRERLLEIIAAAAYASGRHKKGSDKDGFRGVWLRVKPADKPDEGIPFDSEDAIFNPPPSRASQYEIPQVMYQQASPLPGNDSPAPKPQKSHRSRNRIIPPDEDIRRLFQECKIGLGNASLLSQALAVAKPNEIKKSEIINEFYLKCRSSQDLIFAQIDWASAGAERSRIARNHEKERKARERTISTDSRTNSIVDDETVEEKLLASLLAANGELLEALRQYDDLVRVAAEKKVEARSRKEVRMDPRDPAYTQAHAQQLQGESAHRTPSPTPSSRSQSPPTAIALPYRPQHLPLENEPSGLAPPPKVSYGPRSPGQASIRSRTPSPNNFHRDEPQTANGYGSSYDYQGQYPDETASSIYIAQEYRPDDASIIDDEEYDPDAPIRPSAKALGKRRATDSGPASRDSVHSEELYNEQNDTLTDDRFDSDNDSNDGRSKPAAAQFVYDAAAERTQQLLEEATRHINGVH
ncbi:hypothetical protein FA15DRAFT_676054 [Coprinopsis marcescibilis]|uniref:VHS domain-containing protein n=1 Tax=Coprinopsis marcescibilis TaxID=230819 RepID=A0A5C3KBL9_COPMA|nr:hypothetical protein FA15DRAFT_676054 [Coprinopsis marcescibilis]